MFFQGLLVLLIVAVAAYVIFSRRALALAGDDIASLHSRPSYHGTFGAICAVLPAFIVLALWAILENSVFEARLSGLYAGHLASLTPAQVTGFFRDAFTLSEGGAITTGTPESEAAGTVVAAMRQTSHLLLWVVLVLAVAAGTFFAWRRMAASYRARHFVERTIMVALAASSAVAIVTTIGIVLSLIFESFRFFSVVPLHDFLFGLHWSPQGAFVAAGAEEQVNPEVFGAIPLIAGTLFITFIAMMVAAPVGLLAAIYLSDYAGPKMRAVAKPVLEVLAGIPTVVYGFFAALTVAPFFRGIGESVGLSVSSESALAAGIVMGIMIIPFVSSLSDDVINAVPQSLRDGSMGLGATRSETIRRVVLPAALPGIVSALILAVSRAIGETMIVVMAAGLAANLTINPLEAVTTVTVQIVTLLVGDQEFDSAKTLAAFALGLLLFCVTLTLNIIALRVVQKYREQYD